MSRLSVVPEAAKRHACGKTYTLTAREDVDEIVFDVVGISEVVGYDANVKVTVRIEYDA